MTSVFAFVLAALTIAFVAADKNPYYTIVSDDSSLDEVLQDNNLLSRFFDCLMDRGECTPEAKELRDGVLRTLDNDCRGCNEDLTKDSLKVIKFLINNRLWLWRELERKYDPWHRWLRRRNKISKKKPASK